MPFTTFTGPVNTVEGTEGGDRLGGLNINKKVRVNGLGGIDQLNVTAKNGGDFNAISVYGNAGTDTITTGSTITGSLLQGGGGGDAVTVNTSNTQITVRGGAGNDGVTAVVGGDKSIFNGNNNNDLMYVGNTFINSSIFGGAGDDEIRVQSGILDNSSISGDKGNDVINDQGQGITLTLRGNSGIYGNDGNDTINFNATISKVIAQGGSGSDTMLGGSADDTLNGGADNDSISGDDGKDTIKGSAGNDTITGGAKNDNLDGGDGNDIFKYGNGEFTTAETVNGGADTNQILFTADAQTVVDDNFENKILIDEIVTANGVNSIILSTKAALTLTAGAKVTGGTAKDTINATTLGEAIIINGGKGDNVLIGSDKNDEITSDDGADAITGLAGSDTITAGTGTDNIIYTAKDQGGSSSTVTADGKLASGDSIIAFLNGTDTVNVTDALTGAGGGAAEANKGGVDFTAKGFFGIAEDNTTLNYVGGQSTVDDVSGAIGAVKGDANDVGYVGIMNNAKNVVNIFQIFLAATNGVAAALATTDSIAHVGAFNLTAAGEMSDFVGKVTAA